MKVREILSLVLLFLAGSLNPSMADFEKWPDNLRSQLMSVEQVTKCLQRDITMKNLRLSKLDLVKCDKIKLFDLNKFKQAYPETIVIIDADSKFETTNTSAKSFGPGWTSYNPTCTMIAMPSPDKVESRWFDQTLLHEFVHAIEFKNKDHLDAGGKQRSIDIDWDERNIDWMDWSVMIIQDYVPPFEAAIKADNFDKAKAAWETIVAKFAYLPSASANGADHTKNPALPGFLESWFGFRCNLEDIEAFYSGGDAGEKYQAFFARIQTGVKLDVSFLIYGSVIANHLTPIEPKTQKNNELIRVGLEFIKDNIPLKLSGHTARGELLDVGSFGGTPEEQKKRGILAKIKLEISFNADFSLIESFSFSRECPKWIDNSYKTEEFESYSFTAHGIPCDYDTGSDTFYKVEFDTESDIQPPDGFKFSKADYLKTRLEHKKRTEGDNVIEYDNSFREDHLQLDKVGNSSISLSFKNLKRPAK